MNIDEKTYGLLLKVAAAAFLLLTATLCYMMATEKQIPAWVQNGFTGVITGAVGLILKPRPTPAPVAVVSDTSGNAPGKEENQ